MPQLIMQQRNEVPKSARFLPLNFSECLINITYLLTYHLSDLTHYMLRRFRRRLQRFTFNRHGVTCLRGFGMV